MKKLYTLFVFAFILIQVKAQNLIVQQDAGKLYVSHTVAPKENWYSVGRMFNLSPGVIASFNATTIQKGLTIGQKIKIPLNIQNLAQAGQPAADEAFIPLYHTVKEKEGLYRIGQTYNKVAADQIKQWNRMKSDDVVIGSNLVIGYLRVKKELSPLAGGAVQVPSQPIVKTSPPVSETKTVPSVTEPVKNNNTKPAEEKTVTQPSKSTPPSVVNNPPPVDNLPKNTSVPANTSRNNMPPKTVPDAPGTEGAFAGIYKEQSRGNNQVTGVGGIFKSTSGWKDGKYYVLMNKVTPGTVVKITSVSNNRSVYAKVLGEIPPGKENEGLIIRLSNAASTQLQLADTARFDVQLQY